MKPPLRASRALPLRSLRFHWRSSLAVLFGMIVGTAALSGALVVGDSIRHSLRRMALERLGRVDYALAAPGFFEEAVAERFNKALWNMKAFEEFAPAILAKGTAENPDKSLYARGVNLFGVTGAFWKLGDSGADAAASAMDGRGAVINASLARELNIAEGGSILLRLDRPDAIPAESVAGRKQDRIISMRLTVARIIPDQGLGRFGLLPSQQSPLNAWLPLELLQGRIGQTGRINALLGGLRDTLPESIFGDNNDKRRVAALPAIQKAFDDAATLADFGIRLRPSAADPRALFAESDKLLLGKAETEAILAAAGSLTVAPVITNLAVSISANNGAIPYSTISALDVSAPAPLGPIILRDGTAASVLAPDDILLNAWAADDLQAKPGDRVTIAFYVESEPGRLETRKAEFTLRGIAAMEGAAADPGLTPDYPGVQEAKRIRDWDPPFPVDLSKIRDKDEEYWEKHKATPKAFISLERGAKLWPSRFGDYTALRVALPASETAEAGRARFETALLARAKERGLGGLRFRAVKSEALAASAGATDFAGLFIGFSLFIIVAALLLVRLFFALGVERRAKEIGLLMAVGFEPKAVRRLFLIEGAALAAAGALLGTAAGVGYAALMLRGLQTWWSGAIGSAFLVLEAKPLSLAVGAVMGFLCGMLGVWLAVRALLRAEPARLLAGGAAAFAPLGGRHAQPSPRALAIAKGLAFAALGSAVGGTIVTGAAQAGLFFVCGMASLSAALAGLSIAFRRGAGAPIRPSGFAPLARLGARNAARNPSRSLMTVGLVASASFIIVAVAAYRHGEGKGTIAKNSGNGGFALMAESDLPILHDMNTPEGRAELNLEDAAPALEGARVYPMRLNPGDDASCLNLYRPNHPRVLGAPRAFVERGGFAFMGSNAETAEEKANPWRLLEKESDDGTIPAIGDFNTVMWILHSGLGKTIEMDSGAGIARLKIVGLLQGSALQSELVVSEESFKRIFPSRAGYQLFFVETPPERPAATQAALELGLRDFGFDAFPTQERIDSYFAVENAYLSAFQALGGLGLLLGTLGLAAAMLRNIVERRNELALLRAVGYRGAAVAALVFAENALLLALGLAIGAGAALLAVAPSIWTGASGIEWAPLAKTLGAALAFGLASGALAIRAAVKSPILEALRSP